MAVPVRALSLLSHDSSKQAGTVSFILCVPYEYDEGV